MVETTIAFLDKYNGVWSNVPAFVTAVADLKTAVADIGTETGKQQNPTAGATAGKAQTRDALEDKILELADQLSALAETNGDVELAARVELTRSALDKFSDDELGATATLVGGLTTANLPALADYLVTAADVTQLTTLTGAFSAIKTAPRTAVVERAAATSALPDRVAKASRILRGRIDKLVTKFRQTNPDFVAGYRVARVIVDRGGRASATPATASTNTNIPASGPKSTPAPTPA